MKKSSDLSRLLGYAGGRRVLTYLSWVLSAVSALVALVPFWYIWRILKEVLETAPDFAAAIHIVPWGWRAVGFAVLSVLLYIAGLMCSHLAAFRIATNLRLALTEHIARLPLGQIQVSGSGKLRRTIADTAGAAETFLAHQLPDQYRAMATVAGLLVLLLAFDWRLGLLSLLPVALGFACMSTMTGKSMQEKMTEYQNALADMSNQAVEYVRGIPVVKTFGQTVFSFKKFKDTIDNYQRWTIAYTKQLRGPMTAYTLAVNSVFVFLIVGGFWLSGKGVTAALLLDLLFYIIITPVISLTLSKLMLMSENTMLVTDALKRMDAVLTAPALSRPEQPQSPKDSAVTFDHVTFSYDGTKNALEDISLTIGAGETAALVGPSGGGKSTLASLAARFFDPTSGAVSIGGVNVKDMDPGQLMNTVSFVLQNSHLIKASILDNVRLGRPDASETQVMAALEQAQCMDIIEKFPQGVHTVIGSQGVYLSGGEMQRIAIARAILKDAPVLILDEATAFADPDNERKVQAALTRLAQGRTVLMIAHRLSTVTGADKIFVLEEGRLVQQGSFVQLSQSPGLFGRMWNEYQQSVAWNVAKEA
ncbi:ABC transporter ATP-binding protein/permease [Colidextribacter sp. 210702-DFI.3.9]|nr:ABC transporter ATP-binding protein/permease [Colidextribacter sp. 210702-DFI.3.9]MCG4468447.1 ABC transporter ATP-binding protein/permease [Lawsonibacter sp. DFI.6.74]MCG4772738.1 ABC transporter ATP-binding protein/permease [Lawsonibacter sp. DFI.5.51]